MTLYTLHYTTPELSESTPISSLFFGKAMTYPPGALFVHCSTASPERTWPGNQITTQVIHSNGLMEWNPRPVMGD